MAKKEVVEAEVVEEIPHQERFDMVEADKEQMLPEVFTPMTMIERAMASGADADQLEKYWNLQVKYEEREAKKAFVKSMAAFKADCPIIPRNSKGQSGKFAGLADIAGVVDPRLARHGLSYRWSQAQENKEITITCIVTHEDGHSESSPLTGPLDTGGNKNAIQSIGSSNTYLFRYTLNAALGLASAEMEDDGKGSESQVVEYINEEQWRELDTLISQVNGKSTDDICKAFRIESLDLIPASKFANTKSRLNELIKGQS